MPIDYTNSPDDLRPLRIIFVVVACAMLGWALVPTNPYLYYRFLRWIIFLVCLFSAWQASELKRFGWAWVLSITAVIYNPVIPVYATRGIWSVVNVVTMMILILSAFMLHGPRSGKADLHSRWGDN